MKLLHIAAFLICLLALPIVFFAHVITALLCDDDQPRPDERWQSNHTGARSPDGEQSHGSTRRASLSPNPTNLRCTGAETLTTTATVRTVLILTEVKNVGQNQ